MSAAVGPEGLDWALAGNIQKQDQLWSAAPHTEQLLIGPGNIRAYCLSNTALTQEKRAGSSTKMAPCQSHYMKNRRGEKHTMTSGIPNILLQNTERRGRSSSPRVKTASWTSDGSPGTTPRPFRQTRGFQEKMLGYSLCPCPSCCTTPKGPA